jgi:anti-sigma factor RsiW
MSEHESIRKLLALAALGDISPEDMRRVCEHLAGCETCRGVSQDFVALGDALRGLPTPQPRAELVARVRGLAELRLARKCAGNRDAVVLAPLVMAAWIMALATWPLLRAAVRWSLTGWYMPDGRLLTAVAAYSIMGFLIACVSAFAVARRARASGRAR